MALECLVDRLKVIDFHVESLLIVTDALAFVNEHINGDLVPIDVLKDLFDGLILVQVLLLIDLLEELFSLVLQLGHFRDDLFGHDVLDLIGTLTLLTQLALELSLHLVGLLDLTLATTFIFRDDLSADTQLEDRTVKLN